MKTFPRFVTALFLGGLLCNATCIAAAQEHKAPLHARKMAALVQASTGSDRPVLLHYNTKAGHSGGLPVTQQIEDQADELRFLFWQLGVMVQGVGQQSVKH